MKRPSGLRRRVIEQSTAASESLKQQATRLVDAVNVFR